MIWVKKLKKKNEIFSVFLYRENRSRNYKARNTIYGDFIFSAIFHRGKPVVWGQKLKTLKFCMCLCVDKMDQEMIFRDALQYLQGQKDHF